MDAMNDDLMKSRQAVDQARIALRDGDRTAARQWAEKAAQLAPQSEDPWLILAAVASPQASLDYIKKALAVNPESPRARKGMEWAMKRLREVPAPVPAPVEADADPLASLRKSVGRAPDQPKVNTQIQSKDNEPSDSPEQTEEKPKRRKLLPVLIPLLVILICMVVAAAGYSAVNNPALAQILSVGNASQPQAPAPTDQPQTWALAEIAKPTLTATLGNPTFTPTSTLPPLPTDTFTPEPTFTSEFTATPESTATPEATETPGIIEAVIVEDTPTSEYVAPTNGPDLANNPGVSYGGRWIDVNLTQQRVYAYEGDTVVNSFVVSTGTWQTPTVTGSFKIWIKLLSTTMAGPGYYLTNVPYTMYFYKGYGLHGTYWHNNFGTPMSHGCVNLRTSDAEWLYNFASVGTTVNVHY
jgi:lipoprotein-anchoring transpeptidase ErfK/SrfK